MHPAYYDDLVPLADDVDDARLHEDGLEAPVDRAAQDLVQQEVHQAASRLKNFGGD